MKYKFEMVIDIKNKDIVHYVQQLIMNTMDAFNTTQTEVISSKMEAV